MENRRRRGRCEVDKLLITSVINITIADRINLHYHSSPLSSVNSINNATCSSHKTPHTVATHQNQFLIKAQNNDQLCASKFHCCKSRRHFIEGSATDLLPLLIKPFSASASPSNSMAMLNKFHPPRPDWYQELYASVLNSSMKPYEAEIAGYKSQLFDNLRGKAKKVLEIGIGTGPNLKYYAGGTDVQVFGLDPNKKMEKYARAAAVAAGLPLTNFKFIQAVGEVIPLGDASVDAVVGTLVLCSVKDVNMTLQEVMRVLKPGGRYLFVEHIAAKDGTFLKFWQRVLDPLQRTVSDGCHLTRQTGKNITEAGFSDVDLGYAFLSTASLVNPHMYGIARK